jgi:hypothetical protein
MDWSLGGMLVYITSNSFDGFDLETWLSLALNITSFDPKLVSLLDYLANRNLLLSSYSHPNQLTFETTWLRSFSLASSKRYHQGSILSLLFVLWRLVCLSLVASDRISNQVLSLPVGTYRIIVTNVVASTDCCFLLPVIYYDVIPLVLLLILLSLLTKKSVCCSDVADKLKVWIHTIIDHSPSVDSWCSVLL